MPGPPDERSQLQEVLAAIEKVRDRASSLDSLHDTTLAQLDWLARSTSILGVGTAIWDHRGHLTQISPMLEKMAIPWGTAEGWWAMLVAEAGPQQLASKLGAGAELDIHLRSPGGQRHSFRLTASGYIGAKERGAKEAPTQSDMILLVSDTTDSENTQRALLDTEARYRNLFQASSDGILLHDLEGRILEANSKAIEMLAYEPGELLGIRVTDLHPEADRTAAEEAVRRMSQGGNIRFEIGFLRKDGSLFPAEVSASLLETEHGKLVQAIVRDITERKLAEESLRQSEERKSAMLETALDCIVTIDHRGSIVEFNPAAEATFGYRKDEVIGRSMADLLLPEEYRRAHAAGMARYVERGEAKVLGQRLELPALRSDGQTLLMEVAITRLPTSEGEPLFAGYMRDISARKKADERMSQALEEAKEANRAKSDFLASMSHELRTPLNVICGMTELAKDEMESGEVGAYLDTIGSSASSLLALIDDLLDISRIEAGRFEITLNPVAVRPLIEDVCRPLEHRALDKGLQIGWDVDDSVPENLVLDARRLAQVLLNLLSNAIKFTLDGSVSLHVTAEATTRGRHLLTFEVTDTGIGFDPEQAHLIFERFAQLRRPSGGRPEGTGLGLAISHALAQLMGGELLAESQEGRGSIFRLRFEAAEAEESVSPPIEGFSDAAPLGRQEQILLVDDHAGNRIVAARFLERGGYRVIEAKSGEEALDTILDGSAEIDLVLMDIEMMGMDGFEVTRRLRCLEEFARTPIIALTAHATRGFRELCLESGLDDYLSKPVERRELLKLVARHLGTEEDRLLSGEPETPAVRDSKGDSDAGPIVLHLDTDIGDLTPAFLQHCRQVSEVLLALSSREPEEARRIGHDLKGSGTLYGIPEISEIGEAIESAAKQNRSWSAAAEQLGQLLDRIHLS